MSTINTGFDDFFNRLLPTEIQVEIFEKLSLSERIHVGAVCKQWLAVTQAIEEAKMPIFTPLQLSGLIETSRLDERWKEFEAFVLQQNYSPSKKSRVLLLARKIYEEGIQTILSDIQTRGYYLKDPRGLKEVFEKILSHLELSQQLLNRNAYEVIYQLLLFELEKPEEILIKTLPFSFGDPLKYQQLLVYLIEANPELLLEENNVLFLYIRCRVTKNLDLLKLFLNKLSEHYGIDQARKKAILTGIAKHNKDTFSQMSAVDEDYFRYPTLNTKEIKKHIQNLQKEEKNNEKEGPKDKPSKVAKRCLVQ